MSDATGEDKTGGIQVIARTAKILNALSERPGGMSLAEIAKEVELPRSTVQRIVAALGQENLVRADRSDGVRLGPALLRLVGRVHTDVISIVRPHLEQLSAEINETTVLARMSGRDMAFIHIVVAEHVLRVMPRVGGDLPLHSTSGGRALLALHTDLDVKALLGDDYKQVTQSTVHSASGLLRALARIRAQGYAWESNESIEGVSSVAIAIDTVLGPYAICIVAPTARAVEQRELYADRALRLKEILQAEIGRSSIGA
ncbi:MULTISPECIES: IclR family transcriptional regulator [Burkholderiaceae]|uniref:Transcriptional regulator n=1 Tax=Caballeronia zhejiangensis TaxID=871203 RepID=A0A656QG79_9BURK|nr:MULTISPECIES: IclR family transcriptional regulator [Burkholderiaceae]EKS70301.1 TtgV [Burkholderia sp. SJ98]KAK43547.1 transcriptional regulator [Caballeronia jiangsuensis]KDR26098.1 transcriptional regulator [Caballeronia zhejiangensis]KWU24283.1 transcriptional regulator [Burkholderia cenocepacia]MCE4546428.1 IclR family transcriptional regulator [Caballeronia sp. PC1]